MKKYNKLLKGLWSFFEIVIIVYVVLMTAFIIFKNKYGYTQVNNYTFYNVDKVGDKNNSRLKKGNLVIIEKTNDIKKGDMIYYYAIYDESYIVRSDTVEDITRNGSDTMYVVHRDGEDVSVFDSKVLGKKGTLYPHLGTILTIVCSRLGFILLVFLPITVVFLYQVYDFITVIRHEKRDKNNNEDDDEEPVIIESHDTEEDEDNKDDENDNKEEKEKSDEKTGVEKEDESDNKKAEENSNDKTEVDEKENEDKKDDEEKSDDKAEVEKKEEEDKKKNDKKDKKFDVEVL